LKAAVGHDADAAAFRKSLEVVRVPRSPGAEGEAGLPPYYWAAFLLYGDGD
jgi:hypothetical protein